MSPTCHVTLRAWIITADVISSTAAANIVNFMLCRWLRRETHKLVDADRVQCGQEVQQQ